MKAKGMILKDTIDKIIDYVCYDCPSFVGCQKCRAKRLREFLDFLWIKF